MLKKVLAIVLAAVLVCGVCAGCGGAKDDGKYKIGIVQLTEHPALDAATQGFKQAIIDELGEDAVEFDYQSGQNDQTPAQQLQISLFQTRLI